MLKTLVFATPAMPNAIKQALFQFLRFVEMHYETNTKMVMMMMVTMMMYSWEGGDRSKQVIYFFLIFWGQIFDQILTRIFGIRPEWGRDGRDGRTEYSFTVLLGRRNTALQYYSHSKIQFYSTTGTEKYSFTVLLYYFQTKSYYLCFTRVK